MTTHNGIIPEYDAYMTRNIGQERSEARLQQISPLMKTMVRVAIRPEWVGIIDFETRLPSAVEHAIEAMGGG